MNCRRTWAALASSMAGRLSFNASLKAYGSFGIGGPARVLARPDTAAELAELLDICREEQQNYFIIGAGSNLLFSDAGFDGVIIKLGDGFKSIEQVGPSALRAGAAVSGALLLKAALELGLSGLEGLAGIPGSLGGALAMNAGSFGRELGPVVAGLDCLDGSGQKISLEAGQLRFSYRRLEGLPERAIILEALLNLEPDDPAAVKARVDEVLKLRSEKQPKGFRSAGSVFKNPAGESAGRLIEASGFKGRRVGGAQVSEVHANFIVNLGPATCADVLELMELIREKVLADSGFSLEPEIKLVASAGKGGADEEK